MNGIVIWGHMMDSDGFSNHRSCLAGQRKGLLQKLVGSNWPNCPHRTLSAHSPGCLMQTVSMLTDS